jgi:catechol 2,3-dioxygenase-like lactoylglutathione lyase family enzyme
MRPVAVDHVTLAGRDLARMRSAFDALGLATDYGGPHGNGTTQMALLGFDDGSYLELIAPQRTGAEASLWGPQIAADAGPAAWCARGSDLAGEAARLAALGIPVSGPVAMERTRPDGVWLYWDLLFLGDGPPGARLPFVIADRTERRLRVSASAGVRGTELTGVALVVVGVRSLALAAADFRLAFGWDDPVSGTAPSLDARVLHFSGTPVALAEPLHERSWLTERLDRFGESPCAFLLSSRDLARTANRLPLTGEFGWFGRDAAWIEPGRLFGWRLGVIGS